MLFGLYWWFLDLFSLLLTLLDGGVVHEQLGDAELILAS